MERSHPRTLILGEVKNAFGSILGECGGHLHNTDGGDPAVRCGLRDNGWAVVCSSTLAAPLVGQLTKRAEGISQQKNDDMGITSRVHPP